MVVVADQIVHDKKNKNVCIEQGLTKEWANV